MISANLGIHLSIYVFLGMHLLNCCQEMKRLYIYL